MATRRLISALLVLLSTAGGALSASAGEFDERGPSPLIVQPVGPIRPVSLADGRIHLVYELLLINQSAFVVTIDDLTVLDDGGTVLAELAGDSLSSVLRRTLFGIAGTALEPSQSAFVFIDAALPASGSAPASVRHRISTIQTAPASAVTADLGGIVINPELDVSPNVSFITASLPVIATAAVVLAPPVRGDNWVMFRACCDLSTSHRGTTGLFGGAIYVPERFALDFVQISDDARLIVGPANELSSYKHYGQNVYAVADGTVVSTRDGEPDQVPGALPEGLSAEMAGGNSVLLDIGEGRFAFYAHMQPGSVRVLPGDRVRSGDVIGVIGNSGKSIGPHLHFHVVDRSSAVAGDGVPFVFSAFAGQGVLGADALMLAFQGQPAHIEPGMLAGPHQRQYPVNNQVIDFGR